MMNINETRLKELGREQDLHFVVLFGSRTDGSARPDSDFDVAVYTDDLNRDLGRYGSILGGLAQALGVAESRIDLTDLKKADPLLRKQVVQTGRLLLGDERAYARFKVFALNSFIDHEPIFELDRRLIEKRQRIFESRYA